SRGSARGRSPAPLVGRVAGARRPRADGAARDRAGPHAGAAPRRGAVPAPALGAADPRRDRLALADARPERALPELGRGALLRQPVEPPPRFHSVDCRAPLGGGAAGSAG